MFKAQPIDDQDKECDENDRSAEDENIFDILSEFWVEYTQFLNYLNMMSYLFLLLLSYHYFILKPYLIDRNDNIKKC